MPSVRRVRFPTGTSANNVTTATSPMPQDRTPPAAYFAQSHEIDTLSTPNKVVRILDYVHDNVILDSGASDHMHGRVEELDHIEETENLVTISDGTNIPTQLR